MALVRIGDVARQLGVTVATVRYYDDRGLAVASSRIGGIRWYDEEARRRIAFLHVARRLHIPLDVAVQVLDGRRSDWSGAVRSEVRRLQAIIDVARGAQELLTNALECEHEHPARQCPNLRSALDEMVRGRRLPALTAVEELETGIERIRSGA